MQELNRDYAAHLRTTSIYTEVHNFWTSQNLKAAKDLTSPEQFNQLYSDIQAGKDIEGYTYKIENGVRVPIPPEEQYPPKSQLKPFSDLSQVEKDKDIFIANKARSTILDTLPAETNAPSRAAASMANAVRTQLGAEAGFAEREAAEGSRLSGLLGRVASPAILAITVGAQLWEMRIKQQADCAKAYPFVGMTTMLTSAAPGVDTGMCRVSFDVEKLKNQASPVSTFLNLKDNEIQQALNSNIGKMNGPCDYYLKLFEQISSCTSAPRAPTQKNTVTPANQIR